MNVMELRCSNNEHYMIMGSSQKEIQIWDINQFTKMGEAKTHYEFGGQRIAVTDDGQYFAVAAYKRYGITLYDTLTSNPLWTRKDIKRIQKIKFGKLNDCLYVINQNQIMYKLSLENGEIIETREGTNDIYMNPFGEDIFVDQRTIICGKSRSSLLYNQYILDICCLPFGYAYSLMNGGIVIQKNNGHLIWKGENRANEHFIQLFYNQEYDLLYGIAFKYNDPRNEPYYVLYCYEAKNGKLRYVQDMDNGPCFIHSHVINGMISGSGNVFQIENEGISQSHMHIYF